MHDEWSGKQTKLPACQPARRQSSQLALRSPEQPCHMLYPIRTSHGHFLLLCFLCKPRSRSHKVELTFTSLSKLLFQATITIDTYSFCLDGLRFSVINKSLGSYTVPYLQQGKFTIRHRGLQQHFFSIPFGPQKANVNVTRCGT